MTRGLTPENTTPFRHTLELGAAPAESPVLNALEITQRLLTATQVRQSSGVASPAIALTGLNALGAILNDAQLAARMPRLVVAHGDQDIYRHFLEEISARRSQQFADIRDSLLRNAAYLRFPARNFERPATEETLAEDTLAARTDRGVKVLQHAAMRAATISQVRVIRPQGVDHVRVPILHPDAMLLLALARAGRAVLQLEELDYALDPLRTAGLTHQQRDVGTMLRDKADRTATRRVTDIQQLLAPVVRARSQAAIASYRKVTDRVLRDRDAQIVLSAALRPLEEAERMLVTDTLVRMDEAAVEYATQAAELAARHAQASTAPTLPR